jgi:hypothetical protein
MQAVPRHKKKNIAAAFALLGLPKDATSERVKKAFHDLVQVWHPDRFTHNSRLRAQAELKMKELNHAYSVVRDFLESKSQKSAGNSERDNYAESAEDREKTADQANPSEANASCDEAEEVRIVTCPHCGQYGLQRLAAKQMAGTFTVRCRHCGKSFKPVPSSNTSSSEEVPPSSSSRSRSNRVLPSSKATSTRARPVKVKRKRFWHQYSFWRTVVIIVSLIIMIEISCYIYITLATVPGSVAVSIPVEKDRPTPPEKLAPPLAPAPAPGPQEGDLIAKNQKPPEQAAASGPLPPSALPPTPTPDPEAGGLIAKSRAPDNANAKAPVGAPPTKNRAVRPINQALLGKTDCVVGFTCQRCGATIRQFPAVIRAEDLRSLEDNCRVHLLSSRSKLEWTGNLDQTEFAWIGASSLLDVREIIEPNDFQLRNKTKWARVFVLRRYNNNLDDELAGEFVWMESQFLQPPNPHPQFRVAGQDIVFGEIHFPRQKIQDFYASFCQKYAAAEPKALKHPKPDFWRQALKLGQPEFWRLVDSIVADICEQYEISMKIGGTICMSPTELGLEALQPEHQAALDRLRLLVYKRLVGRGPRLNLPSGFGP